jgi:hypothetical protein
MELYTHSKLNQVERERLELLKNCNLIQVGFIPFDVRSSDPLQYSPRMFIRESRRYFSKESLKKTGGFAPSPALSSGAVGEGTL